MLSRDFIWCLKSCTFWSLSRTQTHKIALKSFKIEAEIFWELQLQSEKPSISWFKNNLAGGRNFLPSEQTNQPAKPPVSGSNAINTSRSIAEIPSEIILLKMRTTEGGRTILKCKLIFCVLNINKNVFQSYQLLIRDQRFVVKLSMGL